MKACSALELSPQQRKNWLAAWELSGSLRSPFLHPAYARAIARSGRDIVIGMDATESGFFPLQRQGGQGVALGDRLADVSGAIWPDHIEFVGESLLEACDLRAWNLRNCGSEATVAAESLNPFPSPFIDLSEGVDGWLADLRRLGHSSYKSVQRKTRKIIAEVGPLRLVIGDRSTKNLEQLLEWKDAQRTASGTINLFRENWAHSLANDLQNTSEDGFEGSLDCLYAGDTLVAAHLGLKTDNRLHWWVPAYSHEYHNYSPGLILLFKLAENAQSANINRIDLGPGDERYKYSLSNKSYELSQSTSHRYWFERRLNQFGTRLKKQMRGTVVEHSLKNVRTSLRRTVAARAK